MAKPTRAKGLGVSDEEYERLLAAQGGGCAICGSTPKSRRLHVDHNHKTGEVRGLLCYPCNRALPYYKDAAWLRAAADYLDDSEQPMTAAEMAAVLERMVASGRWQTVENRHGKEAWRAAIERHIT